MCTCTTVKGEKERINKVHNTEERNEGLKHVVVFLCVRWLRWGFETASFLECAPLNAIYLSQWRAVNSVNFRYEKRIPGCRARLLSFVQFAPKIGNTKLNISRLHQLNNSIILISKTLISATIK